VLVSRWVLVVAIVAAGGCASGGTPTLAQKFVRQGVPSVDMGGPKPKTPSRSERASSPLEHASVTTVSSRVSSSASSLENVYPELRDAMWQLRLAPTPAHYMAVARVYRQLGITDTAHDYLARSLAVNGPDPKVLDAMARLWRDWGQPQEGLTYAHRAVYMAPGWAAGQNTLGTVLFALGQRTEARKRFEQAVSLEPDAPWALQNLCVAYQAEGRTREAITACRKADAAKRKSPDTPKESR
jgi:Flp pilus assembly protein TadD